MKAGNDEKAADHAHAAHGHLTTATAHTHKAAEKHATMQKATPVKQINVPGRRFPFGYANPKQSPTNMKNNETLQRDVQEAIKWEPLLHAAEIGVTAKDGVVTLTGVVDSYAKKLEAEDAAKNVAGVKAVAEEITVAFNGAAKHNDTQVATEVVNAFKFNWEIPSDQVHVTVENGWVTLSGTVEWNYQKDAAWKAVKNLAGVKGVSNNLTIKSNLHDAVEKQAIERALGRNWSIDAEDVKVAVSGNRVTLNGIVDSIYQRDEAGRIAWNTPGVSTVDNELVVDFDL